MVTIFPTTQDTGRFLWRWGALDACQQNLVAHSSGLCSLDESQQATCVYICQKTQCIRNYPSQNYAWRKKASITNLYANSPSPFKIPRSESQILLNVCLDWLVVGSCCGFINFFPTLCTSSTELLLQSVDITACADKPPTQNNRFNCLLPTQIQPKIIK